MTQRMGTSKFSLPLPVVLIVGMALSFFTAKEMTKGTGLGLSVSYGIIGDMGATLSAENVAGGARFAITLPIAE